MTTETIGWAIIHSLWQGGVIAAILALVFALTRRQPASTRYVIGLAGLALMLGLPIVTAVRTAPILAAAAAAEPSLSPSPSASTSPTIAPNPLVSASQLDIPVTEATPAVPASPGRFTDPGSFFLALPLAPVIPWIAVAWLVGLLIISVRLIGGVSRTRRLTRRGVSPASERVHNAVVRLSEQLRVRQVVRVLESTLAEVPLVIGVIRPVIVVPASLVTGLTPLQLNMLVAHELAHVRRYDFAVNLVQTVIDTLLFYHPAVRWLSDRVRDERENCCDDIAVAVTGGDTRTYTTALLMLEEARSTDFGLAAAATGGSLLRRARRLLTGEPSHLELGPRWIAGVITIAAALLTGNEAMGSGIQASFVPMPAAADSDRNQDSTKRKPAAPDAGRARPETVVRSPAGPLRERWRWAEQRGRAMPSQRYWVGYLIAGDPSGRERFYFDRDIPVRMDQSTFYGRMQLGDGNLSGFLFYGVPLSPLVGAHAPTSTAIFLRMNARGSATRLERIHAGTFALPVHFDRLPVMWLDSAGDAESIEIVRSLQTAVRTEEDRRDLIALIGIHQDTRVVVPLLIAWLENRSESEGVRREAAEWLGKKADPRGVAALARAARNDRSNGVRREAIEAFSHMPLAAATDTLISFAQTIRERDLVRVALEALGHRTEPGALAFLERTARTPGDTNLRVEAVEALAEMPDGRGMSTVAAIARSEASSDVRSKAVEGLGSMEPTSRALEVLLQIARNDSDGSVRNEAVETIAEVHDARSVSILRELAVGNYDEYLQIEAVESLGETVSPREAVVVLRSIARSHPRADVRKKALETLGDIHDESSALQTVIDIARNDRDSELRLAAVRTLGDSPGDRTAEVLTFLKSLIANDPDRAVRLQAVNALEELPDDAGMATLRELARSSRDPEVKDRARELLDDR